MGRRRSHHRVDDRGDDRKLGNRMSEGKLSKPKQALNDEGGESKDEVHQRSKGIKRGDKRKRDNDTIVSRKRHAERPKSKYPLGSSKMSSKQKTKQFSRWKSFSGSESGLSGGKSSDSSMRFSNSSCHSDSDDSGCSSSSREHSRKRSRAHHFEDGQIIETVNKDCRKRVSRSRRRDGQMCNSRSKLLPEDEHESQQHGNTAEIRADELIQGSACFKGVTTFGVEGRHSKFLDERVQVCISKALEQEGQLNINLAGEEAGLDDGAIKAKILEVELRQKALANLMRHRDATCGRNNKKEISNSSVPIIKDTEKGADILEEFTASTNQHSNIHAGEETKVSTPEISHLPGLVNLKGVDDGNIDENRWPLASDMTPQRIYSLEPKKDVVHDSTSGSHMAPKLVAVGDLETVRKSNFEVEKISRGSALLCLDVTDTSDKNSLLPLENEVQVENKLKLRTTSEPSRNRDFCKNVAVSGEETNSGMANCFSELAKAGASQAEVKRDPTISESISTNDVEHSENEVLPCETLHLNLEQENKGSNDKIEPSEDRESPVDTGLSRDENIADTNTIYIAATSMRGKSPNEIRSLVDPLKDCGRESAQAAPKPEIAPQKQEDGASMFQRKTMSVMRGGELVQVNYKVYIPKRAAELAKRRLQR